MIGELVARLIAAGTPPEVAASVVAEAFAEGSVRRHSADIVDEQAERRRAADRERKRGVRRHSAESADIPQTSEKALTLKKDNKRVRAKKHPLSADWKPNEAHYEAAAKLHIPRESVLAKAEDMRIWAGSTGAVKLDWDLTFHGFLRRDASKLAKPPPPAAASTHFQITPKSSSWNPWKSHYRDTGQNGKAALMDKFANDDRPFTVPTEYPPGWKA